MHKVDILYMLDHVHISSYESDIKICDKILQREMCELCYEIWCKT